MRKSEIREKATELFGEEKPIVMQTSDARYRYYQWLLNWFGAGRNSATHKCPFYQFMFWGTIVLLVSYPFFIISLVLYYLLFKPLSWVIPPLRDATCGEDSLTIEELRYKKPFVFMLTMNIIFFVAFLIGVLLFGDAAGIYWIGWVIFALISIPAYILHFIWWGGGWILWGLWWLLSTIFVFFANLPWIQYTAYFAMGIGLLLAVGIFFWIMYRLAIAFFTANWFKNLIKWSCTVRDDKIQDRRRKIAERNLRLAEERKKREAERKKWEKEHADEIKAAKIAEKEKREIWDDRLDKIGSIISAPFKGTWTAIVAIALIVWWPFNKIGQVIYVGYHMFTETISNHCPPIDFIYPLEIKGEVQHNSFREKYWSINYPYWLQDCNYMIVEEELVVVFNGDHITEYKGKDFEIVVKTDSRPTTVLKIDFNVCTKTEADYHGTKVVLIHSINSIVVPRKTRAKKK